VTTHSVDAQSTGSTGVTLNESVAVEAPANNAVIELIGVTKRFPGVVANHNVNLIVRKGEVHAIVGENGSGKSTLMKALYGMYQPEEGTIKVNGTAVSFKSPKDAIAAGIGMVHQHFMLADNFTVWENVILGSESGHAGLLNVPAAKSRIREIGASYGTPLDPDRLAGDLSVSDRQMVEITKVLYRGARILILDEPTSALVPQEVEDLFENVRDLTKGGVTVLFISHKLDEVLAIANRISVLRGGEIVTTVEAGSVDARQLAELMVGSELPSPESGVSTVQSAVVLSVKGLGIKAGGSSTSAQWVAQEMAFDVHRGEIVGIAGVKGNGQEDLIDALMGLTPLAEGSIAFEGVDITSLSTRQRREMGMAYIPEERHREGLLLSSSLWENELLGHQTEPVHRRGFRGWFLNRSTARKRTEEIVKRYDVRTPNIDVAVAALSGGNQQKFIIGREMAAGPKLLIAAHPTLGIDVGAQGAVWSELRHARKNGLAVVLVSADLDELIGLSDRLIVVYSGRIVATLDPSNVTPRELGSFMTGAHEAKSTVPIGSALVDTAPALTAPVTSAPVDIAPSAVTRNSLRSVFYPDSQHHRGNYTKITAQLLARTRTIDKSAGVPDLADRSGLGPTEGSQSEVGWGAGSTPGVVR
jgi:general nucleoside transport system ATP-binding protein